MGLFGFGERFAGEQKKKQLEEDLDNPMFDKTGLGEPTQERDHDISAPTMEGVEYTEDNTFSNKDIVSGQGNQTVSADEALAMEVVDGSELLQKEITEESEGEEEEEGVSKAA